MLGPVRVEDNGDRLDIGGPKQRTVLALLLASVGRTVPTDVLLMEAYGPDVDSRLRRSIQTWMSGFRRDLGLMIESGSGGYRLELDRESIDAHRFERYLREARALRNDAVARTTLRRHRICWFVDSRGQAPQGAVVRGTRPADSARSRCRSPPSTRPGTGDPRRREPRPREPAGAPHGCPVPLRAPGRCSPLVSDGRNQEGIPNPGQNGEKTVGIRNSGFFGGKVYDMHIGHPNAFLKNASAQFLSH